MESGFGTVEHHLHGKRRAALSPLFASRAIANAKEIIHEQVEILSGAFEKKFTSQEVAELRSVFVAFTLDTVHQYAMGVSTDLQRNEQSARKWWLTLRAVSQMTPTAKQFPFLLSLGQKVPLGLIRVLKPEMAGLLEIHEVRLTSVLAETTLGLSFSFNGSQSEG